MPPTKHALLGASGSATWLACPPSARLSESIPDRGSNYAAEGTLAHELAELKVRKHFTPMSKTAYTRAYNKIKKSELYTPEMDHITDTYLDYLKDCAMQYDASPSVLSETQVDFSGYVPEGYGTADCIMLGGNTMRVIDFKYGKGVPVSAVDNSQMKLYAIGALVQYALLYKIERVVLTIAQLRLDEPEEWETTPDELYKWAAEYVQPRAKLAWEGKGEFDPGSHCRFCKAKAKCRAYAEANMSIESYSPASDPRLLSDAEIGDVLTRAEPFVKWLEAVRVYALDAVLEGKTIPGWKAVEGRSVRQFDDLDQTFTDLQAAGIDEAILYERKPLTLAAVEKLLGKKQFAELCGTHIIRPMGKPTLAPESDKRPPYSRAAADFENIQEN